MVLFSMLSIGYLPFPVPSSTIRYLETTNTMDTAAPINNIVRMIWDYLPLSSGKLHLQPAGLLLLERLLPLKRTEQNLATLSIALASIMHKTTSPASQPHFIAGNNI
uniref:Putative secreted protein n=1 Tax=Anopheles darlingi TaxID=43151 RepID=A0A2M4D2F9_ANODA